MEVIYGARDKQGNLIFVGKFSADTCETLQSQIGDFDSLESLKQHPKVFAVEKAQPVNESVSMSETDLGGGVILSQSEWIVFSTLDDNRGNLVRRDVLEKAVEMFGNASSEQLTLLVSRVRAKISKLGYSIASEYRQGYRLHKND